MNNSSIESFRFRKNKLISYQRINNYESPNDDIKETKDFQYNEYLIHEQLLQSYRQIFIGAQSFFVAAIAIGYKPAELNDSLLAWISIGNLLFIWCIWHRVVRARHLIVDFHRFYFDYLDEYNKIPAGPIDKKEFLKLFNFRQRKNIIDRLDGKMPWRITRIKMDLLLPIVFSVIWFLLAFYGKSMNEIFKIILCLPCG